MVNFSEPELGIIRSTAAERGDGKKQFSFYKFAPILEENKIEAGAKELGQRIRESVSDETDDRLPFRFEHIYPDGKPRTDNDGAIAYILK